MRMYALLLVTLVTGCGDQIAPSPIDVTATSPAAESTLPSFSSPSGEAEQLEGTLFLISGFTTGTIYGLSGCPVLTTSGTRHLVIYPAGWDVREGDAGIELVDPSGDVRAHQGDKVTVVGHDLGPSSFGCTSRQFEAIEVLEINGAGQPIDYEVAEAYLRNLTGSSCSSGVDATIGVPDSLLSAADALPSDHNDWLRSGVWLGSGESLRTELGGELIADRDTYFWVVSTGEDGAPFAQLARSIATDTGRRLWFLAGSVHSLDASECQ